MQRNHQSHTCQNHNVDAETFESPRSERLGSLKIAIVQKSLGGKCHQRWRKHYLQCFTPFTLCTLFTILKLHTLFTLYNYVCSIMVLSKKRNGLLEWIPFRLLQLLEHLRNDILSRPLSHILDDLFWDTPLDHIWHTQLNSQIL